MHYLFCVIFFLLGLCVKAQGFKARHSVPNASDNSTKALFEISPGNYIGAGFAIDTSTGMSINQIVITGLGTQGQLLWTKKYKGHKIEYLNNGFIQRCFYKKDNYLYYAGCVADTAGAQIGVFIKFDMNGDTLWQRKYRDTMAVDLIPQIVTASVDNGFLITGFFQDWVNHTQQGLILKTDANGNELWRRKINKAAPNVQDGKAIVQDSASKKIAIVGYQYLTAADNHDNILILDSLGIKITQGHFTYPGGSVYDLIQTQDKKFVMVGIQIYSETVGGYNCQRSYAAKFDINNPGTAIWKIDGYDKLGLYNAFTCVTEQKNGDLLIGGYLDTMQGVWNGSNNKPSDFYTRLTIVNKNGQMKWNRYYNYKINSPILDNGQVIHSINLCSDGGWLAAIESQNYPGVNPFLFVKYDSTGCDSSLAYCKLKYEVGLKEFSSNNLDVKIFPNPVAEVLNIKCNNQSGEGNLELSLIDVQGREVKRITIKQEDKIDVSDIKNGMYLLTVTKEKEVVCRTKIIKED